jgi:Protein of unknown function (DUF4233)
VRGLTFYGTLGRLTGRMLALVLFAQAIAVFFGALLARALAASKGSGDAGRFLVLGSVLALLCLVAAGLMRRPYGVTVGWLIQLATLLSAAVVPAMLVVGVLFLSLWVFFMVQGARVEAAERADR